jgi:UDP-N-acetyl-2-amino-2-deoxyglucuronate dehydrogenase
VQRSPSIRVAIIGCGVIAPTHAKALALDGRAELVLACDPDLVKARALGASRISADWHDALAPDIDLVVVCTPHHLHAMQALAVLHAGKHLLCEKPLATLPSDVQAMVYAAQSAGTVASGIFQHRFAPLARRLHGFMRGGDFGPLLHASMEFRCSRTPAYYASGPWRGRWAGEGGALMINQAIHTLDLLSWLCGRPTVVAGEVSRRSLASSECEDHAQGTITFAGETSAPSPQATILCVNDQTTEWFSRITIACRDGEITLGDHHRLLAIEHPNQALVAELQALDTLRLDGYRLPGKDCYGDHHALQIQDVLSAITRGRQPMVSIADAAVTNQLVLGLYSSSVAQGAPIELPARAFARPQLVAGPLRSDSAVAAMR